jgi:membrane associated rhomboid family serine protease
MVYGVSLLAGSAASYAFSVPVGYSLGASGAVFGLFGSTIVVMRRLNREIGGLVGIVVIILLLPLFIPNIDWHAHVGGLVAGTLVTVALVYAPRRLSTFWVASTAGVVLAASLALVAARTVQLRNDPVLGPLVQQVQQLEQSIHGNPL